MSSRLLLLLVGVVAGALFAPLRSVAQYIAGAGASLQFFPLVVVDGTHDTMIQLANGSPQRIFVRCSYTPGGAGGVNAAVDFDLVLFARQPTHWVASAGRLVDPNDQVCGRVTEIVECDGAGFDPGRIPPLPDGFEGDLLCVQVDRSGAPMSGNALRGFATLVDTVGGDVAKYPGVGLAGNQYNDADASLCLGGPEQPDTCPRGAEYAACPEAWVLEHRAEGAAPGAAPGTPGERTRLAIVTCSRRAGSGAASVQLQVFNELEQRFSASVPVQRWAEIALADNNVFSRDVLGTDFAQTVVRSSMGSPGIIVVALGDRRATDGGTAGGSIAAVPHPVGARADQDRIVLVDQ
jgi:hypothetical protein